MAEVDKDKSAPARKPSVERTMALEAFEMALFKREKLRATRLRRPASPRTPPARRTVALTLHRRRRRQQMEKIEASSIEIPTISTTRPQPHRQAEDLAKLLDEIAERWTEGLTLGEVGKELELSRETIAGLVARAREHGDDRFHPHPPKPRAKPLAKSRVLKPTDETVGNSRAPPSPPEPPRPVAFLRLRPGQCRFPVNSPERGRLAAELVCCGEPIVRWGAAYCSRHEALTRSHAPSRPSAFSLSPRALSPPAQVR
jgi:hypothetical protein